MSKLTPPVIVIFGPTGSGKSGLALGLAEALGGEIINADSRQIYKEMPIITACPEQADYVRVQHHLYEFLDPRARYSAGQYAEDAARAIAEVQSRGKLALVVGGTGFYLRALMEGISEIPAIGENVALEIEAEVNRDVAAAYGELQRVDPVWAEGVRPSDPQRIARGLVVHRVTGTPLSAWFVRKGEGAPFRFVRVGLNPPREVVHANVEVRWRRMVEMGVVEEARALRKAGYTLDLPSIRGLGIADLWRYLDGEISLDRAVELGVVGHRQYVKRQSTWMKNQYKPEIELGSPEVGVALEQLKSIL